MAEPAAPKPAVNPWLIAGIAGMAAFMEVLDISIANVALQHIAGSLSSTQDELTWVLTSYLVTNAVILLMSGWLSVLIGRKRYFTWCIAGFGLSSLLCGIAPTLGLLILFRGLQGLIGGGLQPVAQAILADAFPPAKRGMAFSIYGLAVVFAPAIGPTLGGWITDNYSWRWVFLINIPVSVVLAFFATQLVTDPPAFTEAREKQRKAGVKIDYIGFALLAAGMGALQVVLDRGQIDDWFGSGLIVTLTIVAVLGLLFFVLWELHEKNPIIDLSLLRNPNFTFGNILMLIFGGVLLGSTVLVPEFSQEILGYTATDAGKVISPGGMCLALLMPVIGVLMSRANTRYLIACGLTISAAALLHMANLDQQADYGTIALSRVYQALGIGLLFIPINTLAFQGIHAAKSSAASAIINMMRNVGGSIGISAATTMLQRRTQVHRAYLAHNVASGNPNYRNATSHLQAYLNAHLGSSVDALAQTNAVLNRALDQQARLLAYIDDFQLLALACVIMLPLLLFVRKTKAEKGKPVAAH